MHLSLRPLAAALATLCASSLAYADTALAPISVTAKGYESDTLTTPSSVFVGNGNDLRKNGANNLGEALRGEPGFSVASDGAQGQNPVVRGLKKESVALLVDGMRLNSAQPAGAIGSFMSLGLADRVEAVKGPASVLYGTGAIGGAINVLMPQARFKPGAKATLGASYDSASKGIRGTGVANLSQGDHALMIGTSIANIDDYKAPDGRVDRTGYDSRSFIGQYRFRIDSQQQLRLSLQKHEDEDVWYPGSTKPFRHPTNPAITAAVASTTTRSPSQERTLAEIGYSYKGAGEKPLNVDVRAYRQEMEREIYSWSNRLNRDIATTHVGFETVGFDAKADWLIHPQHLLSFGMNLWEMDASPKRMLALPQHQTNFVRSDPFDSGRITAAGLYLQDDMRFGKLNLLAAGRYDKVSGSADSVANSANPTGARRTTGLDRDDSAFSGSLGASYEVDPLLRPYASLSRGFRAGEMRERYESSPRGDGYYYVGDPQIKPEISTQLELGIKGQSEKFAWSTAIFRNQIRDYMSGQDISGTARATTLCGGNASACKETVNISKVVIDGIEVQGKWQAWRGHWLKAGLTLLRGENKELNEPLFQMPANELSLGWEGHVAPGWTADVTGRFVSEQDRVATVFSRGGENKTAGFATADLGATYKLNKQHSFRVALKNAFDRKYHEALTEGVSGQEIHMPGRSLAVSWKGDF